MIKLLPSETAIRGVNGWHLYNPDGKYVGFVDDYGSVVRVVKEGK